MYFVIAFVVQLLHSGSNDETISVDNVLDVDDTSDPDVVLQYGKIIW